MPNVPGTPIATEPNLPVPTPEVKTKPKRGGPSYHKPGCACYPCAARRRKEEAGLTGAGLETPQTEVLSVDGENLPTLIAQDRSPRGRVAEWIAIRATDPSLTNNQIAERLGITPKALNSYIAKAVREKWLKFDDPLERMEHEIIPLATEEYKQLLKDGDKTAVIEAAKGLLFPLYKDSKGVTENQQSILAIKIEYPKKEGEVIDAQVVKRGTIVGKPNIFD